MTEDLRTRAVLKPAPDVVSRDIAGEHLLVPVRNGTAEMDYIYMANEVGSVIVRLLDGRRDADVIARVISEEFDVTEEQARVDVRRFLDALRAAGLARDVEEGGA